MPREPLAERAAALVPPGRVTVGTTGCARTAAVRAILARRRGLTLVTTALTPVLALRGGAKVLLTGGAVRDPAQGCVGAVAEAALRARPIDIAVITAGGIDGDGLSASCPEQASVARTLVEHASRVIAVVPGAVFGAAEGTRFAGLAEVDDVVTDVVVPSGEFVGPVFHVVS
ncbi:DeoR/GlpR family DNA-binding transcription regulator [Allokutzneria albata]|uniref:hypothetical protein n=1 Tax=Allokutzneria albata TaxID=211114 RepID=UPI0022B26E49|nr:hypothetical protein [Allokutzneria albata]